MFFSGSVFQSPKNVNILFCNLKKRYLHYDNFILHNGSLGFVQRIEYNTFPVCKRKHFWFVKKYVFTFTVHRENENHS